jgi:hypothetical protein
VAQKLRGCVVHPVDVLEHEKRRRVEQLPEQGCEHTVKPCAPERRVEVVDLGRRVDLQPKLTCS